ncbi:MAG: hypothetical protein KC549_01685, partial [Myxococcales bacterium]|nr:hypothetical protein [Myxococcales bacterium]
MVYRVAMNLRALPLCCLAALLGASGQVAARRLTDADLAPIHLGRDDAGARELIARQEWAAAAAKVDGAGPGPRFVRGWLLEKAGKGEEALKALAGVERGVPVLADAVSLVRGEALARLERYDEAAGVLGLTVVLADGSAVTLGGPRLKDVAGLSLVKLFVGSEG